MSERRRQNLVTAFQYRLAKRMFVYWCVYQLTLFNVLFCWQLLKNGPGSIGSQYVQFLYDFYPMLICFGILVPAIVWDVVKFCHRVAGPIDRFNQLTQQIANDEPVRRLKLREADELHELMGNFNNMLESLNRRHAISLVEEDKKKSESLPGAELNLVNCEYAQEPCSTTAS